MKRAQNSEPCAPPLAAQLAPGTFGLVTLAVKRSPGIKVSLAAPALNRATHRRTFACRPETRAKDPEPGILTALAASSLTNTALHFTRGSRITALSVEAIPSLGHRIGLRIHPGTRALNSAGHMTDVTDVSSPSSDLFCTLTPDSYSPRRRVGGCPVVTLEEIEGSASPALKNKDSIMPSKVQRTPQPPLTQAKLTGTGMLQLQSPAALGNVHPSSLVPADAGRAGAAQVEEPASAMDTSVPPAGGAPRAATHSEHIIKSFNASLNALAGKVGENSSRKQRCHQKTGKSY